MGCGASQQAARPASEEERRADIVFTTESAGMIRFRDIVETRTTSPSKQDSDVAPRPSIGRSSSAPGNPASSRAQSDRDPDNCHSSSDRQYNRNFCASPSSRADAIISHRTKSQNGNKSPKLDRISSVPVRIGTDKDAGTMHFLQKVVRSYENSTLFGELSSSHLNRLVRAMRRVDLQPGDMVIQQGDNDADCCYICGQGCKFEVLINGEHRRMLKEGDVFGEIALLYNSARTASVRANVASHCWKLERSSFQQTARELANELTEGLTMWLQSEFAFFGDANLKSLRPLALVLKRMEMSPGQSLHSKTGVVYLVERGGLRASDHSITPANVFAILASKEDADHLQAEEMVWRRQRQDFIRAHSKPPLPPPDAIGEEGSKNKDKFVEVLRLNWSDRSATQSEQSTDSSHSRNAVPPLSIESYKTVWEEGKANLEAGPQGASLLYLPVRQWSLLVTRMYRLAFDWDDLRHHATFSMMQPGEFKELQRLFTLQRSYQKDATVVSEGSKPSEFYLLVDGTVSVRAQGGRWHQESRGFFFGCANDERLGANVKTVTECVFAVYAVDENVPQRLLEMFQKLCAISAPIISAIRSGREHIMSLEDLEHVADIGSGGYGTVVLMRHKTDNQPVAVKVLVREVVVQRQQCAHVMSERSLLTDLHHPFIVELLATFKDTKRLFMAMEFIVGGELWSLLAAVGTLSVDHVRFILGSLTLATQHMHARHYVYRDFKPENVMLASDGYVKLIDFGFCKKLQDNERTFTACGTVEYMAPELITLKGHSFEVDWWSIGVLTYECFHGYTPFSAESTIEDDWQIIRTIVDTNFAVKYDEQLSTDIVELLKGLLTHDHTARMDSSAIKRQPFFSDFDWTALLNKQLTPPHVPEHGDPFDTRNFEPEIEEHLSGKTLLGMEAEDYPILSNEWDADF